MTDPRTPEQREIDARSHALAQSLAVVTRHSGRWASKFEMTFGDGMLATTITILDNPDLVARIHDLINADAEARARPTSRDVVIDPVRVDA